ncbi:MAG: hypothetical protein KDJ24_13835, partial [Gammaproteobacteria bacterium]|nr:hypothetical protein [Gammaproteobacteria bacterium]
EYLSMMGSDDWAEPGWLSTMMEAILAHPSASFAFSNLTLQFQKTGETRAARDESIPAQLLPSVEATRQVLEWTSHMFSWWIVGAIVRSEDYFAVSGIARYATVHNGDYPLSLGLLTRGDACYVDKRLANYRLWGCDEGKADGRRQAVIVEDMVRIHACIETDKPVRTLCAKAGWSLGRIKRRFIALTIFWIDLRPGKVQYSTDERERIVHGLDRLVSARLRFGILLAPIFAATQIVLRVIWTFRGWISRKLLRR